MFKIAFYIVLAIFIAVLGFGIYGQVEEKKKEIAATERAHKLQRQKSDPRFTKCLIHVKAAAKRMGRETLSFDDLDLIFNHFTANKYKDNERLRDLTVDCVRWIYFINNGMPVSTIPASTNNLL